MYLVTQPVKRLDDALQLPDTLFPGVCAMICMFIKFCYCLFPIIIFVKKSNNIEVQIANINKKQYQQKRGRFSKRNGWLHKSQNAQFFNTANQCTQLQSV